MNHPPRKYNNRRTFRITFAPDAHPPSVLWIREKLYRLRPDTEWEVQECMEDSPLVPPTADTGKPEGVE